MISNIKALSAYNQASQLLNKTKETGLSEETGGGFANLVKNYGENVQSSLEGAEQTSLKFVAGQASVSDLVTKLGDAQTELTTMVKLLEKMVSALDEIRKMPL
ncbi:MAG: flagellar hook-basal body complex protein FliE [Alphaproteobacteria bacterium]|jgi:flagellar hook-basal body complex protein FliE